MTDYSALRKRTNKLEFAIQDMPRVATAPEELAAELAECKAREPGLYKLASKGDASAGAELLIVSSKLRVLPEEIEEAKAAVGQSLGPLLDLAEELREQLIADAHAFTDGLTDQVTELIEKAVAPSLPPNAAPNYINAAMEFAKWLPGYSAASAVAGRLSAIDADYPSSSVRNRIANWPRGLTSYTHHDAFKVSLRTLAVAQEFLKNVANDRA